MKETKEVERTKEREKEGERERRGREVAGERSGLDWLLGSCFHGNALKIKAISG